ncbi:MAG: Alpha-amylase [Promethearchaeota archaeon]|nr:MAG: Alpha-amylase [Candidatus Lokiarchaeota archaeon]
MKISRKARTKYKLDDFEFTEEGNLNFNGEVYPIRLLAQRLNQERDLINFPELAVKIGQLNGVALIYEIYEYIIELYKEEHKDFSIHEELYEYLKENVGEKKFMEVSKTLIKEFPPEKIYKNKIDAEEYLEEKTDSTKRKKLIPEQFISLWLANKNPAFSPYVELFSDDPLKKKTNYKEICEEIQNFFEEKPEFPQVNQKIIDLLESPIQEAPHSIKDQLEYMHEKWSGFLGKFSLKILTALDLIREEEMFRGLGPGESKVIEYEVLEERFTPDKEWMPKVVMIAKHTYVWLHQLSKKYNRPITKLHEIPNEELDQLGEWGFNALWLIGVWERSRASETIKKWCGNPEAAASAYSIYDYVIAHDLGGKESYENLKDRANERGIRLASDMVPNHTGIVSKWTMEHPEWFVQLDHKPFPSYSYSGESLSGDSNIGIFLEDKYFSRSDAAVTFKRVDYRYNDSRYIYHGNDGTSYPWNDTAQLNYLIPEVREAVIQTILYVSRLFPIIRFDAAMTLTRKHFQRLWFPEPGTGGAIPSRAEHGMTKEEFYKNIPKEFWREVVDRINKENPDTLLIAEAFWLLEGFFVRTLGMHRVYNSAFMNMLSDEDNAKFRAVLKNTLEFDPKILKRFVNFMNNPDEETAIKQFGDGDKYFGVCTLLVTMPGLPMFGHGQIQGFEEKYGMEFKRSYWEEPINWGLVHRHENQIFPLMKKRYLFADVKNFLLYDFFTGNYVNEDVYAFSNRINDERGLIVYHNKYAETKGFIRSSVGFAVKEGDGSKIVQKTLAEGLNLPNDGYCIFKDYITSLEYIRRNKEIYEKGLYLELKAYETHAFLDFRIVQDDEYFHYAQLHDLLDGRGVQNIDQTFTQVIYQPLHSPFEKLVNVQKFEELIEAENKALKVDELSSELTKFLSEVKKYSSGENEIAVLKEKLCEKFEFALKIDSEINKLNFESEDRGFIGTIIPSNNFEWGILLSWIFIHQLGKIVSTKNYELLSRSWIDDWQLSKYIQLTLEGLKSEENQNPNQATTLIKLLTGQQNLLAREELKNKKISVILKQLLSDSDAQKFLDVNRYQDTLWFSAEAFSMFCDWFALITVLNRLVNKSGHKTEDIEKIITIIRNWKIMARKADYKVNTFLEYIE